MTGTADHSINKDLSQLRPRNELAPYWELCGSAALFPQFAAVVARLRPGMDCWIPFKNLEPFIHFVEKIGLAHEIDCAFRPLPVEGRDRIVGAETLCTTHAEGVLLEDARPDDEAHLFVGCDKHAASGLRNSGWYPVVVDNRVFPKPLIDHGEFGRQLGYPACCIAFFGKSNNWNRTNSYAEAWRASKRFDHRANCFGKNVGYSLNFHLPCRFDCPRTIRTSARLLDFLRKKEPEYADAVGRLLQAPVLSLNEREVMLLDGRATADRCFKYGEVVNLFSTPEGVLRAAREGDSLEIRGRFVAIFRRDELVETLECRCDEFGPRVPLLFSWV